MNFFGEEDHVEMELDEDGYPRDADFYTGTAIRVYNAVKQMAEMHGCNCKFKLFVCQPFEDFCAMQLEHEVTCRGGQRQAGMQGRN